MPAKTPLKLKKKTASKPAARAAAPKSKGNDVSKTKQNGHAQEAQKLQTMQAAEAALRAENEKLKQDTAGTQDKVSQLEMQIANDGDQLKAVQARLTTREAEIEAARSEAQNLRDQLAKAKAAPEPGKLRCPRCNGAMTEVQLESVRVDKCNSCHGIFLDNGELETVLKHHDEQREAGSKHWFAGLFGRK
jgi:chromosome segregation ATPase